MSPAAMTRVLAPWCGLAPFGPEPTMVKSTRSWPWSRRRRSRSEATASSVRPANGTYVPFAGRTELAVASDLDRLLRDHGHERVDFTIVGSGPNGANPHHGASIRVIAAGDMVVLDFGGFVGGYGSDTTRTVHVGQPTEEHQRVHDVVREAQQIGVDAVRPGVACQDVDRAVRAHIAAAGFGEEFTHR